MKYRANLAENGLGAREFAINVASDPPRSIEGGTPFSTESSIMKKADQKKMNRVLKRMLATSPISDREEPGHPRNRKSVSRSPQDSHRGGS
jgi:hypothetical protein